MPISRGTVEQPPPSAVLFPRTPRRLGRFSILLAVTFGLVLALVATAHAGNEGGSCDPQRSDCEACHTPDFEPGYGPHGFYSDVTDKCMTCHTVHDAPGQRDLLPRNTVRESCFACHDGTGGQGVYGALASRGLSADGGHSCDETNVIPGGNGLTGLEATRSFVGENHYLSCDDCHSPHNCEVVNDFRGERFRGGLGLILGYYYPDADPSSKLLKQRPTGASSSTVEYGSDWCAGCHVGRMSGRGLYTHPVDSRAETSAPFTYNNVALLDSGGVTTHTVFGAMTDGPSSIPTNRGYLMPYPRSSQQTGHLPICQQCHEDSRDVGTLTVDGAEAALFSITATEFAPPPPAPGQYPDTDNPRFQNFPHETRRVKMLVETGDNLCLNCHLPENLP